MSGFAGFFDAADSLREDQYLCLALVRRMERRIAHRGQARKGEWVSDCCALAQVDSARENSVIPVTNSKKFGSCTIGFDGQLDGSASLWPVVRESWPYYPEAKTDASLVLSAYLHFGMDCVKHLHGSFAFALADTQKRLLFLCRDRFGVKPLFFTISGTRIAFASEIKALLEYPGVRPEIEKRGLQELLGIGPMRSPGQCIFKGIHELHPGCCGVFDANGFHEVPYYTLPARPHIHGSEQTKQILTKWISANNGIGASDPIKTIDQSPPTYKHWVDPILARDLPGTALEDAQFIRECRAYAAANTPITHAVLPILLDDRRYPLPDNVHAKHYASLLHPEIAALLALETYAHTVQTEEADEAPILRGESAASRCARIQRYRKFRRVLPHLLERLDRCAAFCGADLRIPDLDLSLIEYLYNIPSGLLSTSDLLSILTSNDYIPVPGTTPTIDHPSVQQILFQFRILLQDREQPLHRLFKQDALRRLSDFPDSLPMVIYFLQLNLWMVRYNIRIVL